VHDGAAIKEGFGVWKEYFYHVLFQEQEAKIRAESEKRNRAEEKRREEERKERLVHVKTRSDFMIKYFSEKVSPAVHDRAAKMSCWGVWKEE
jgi:hypothetical protein